MMTKAKKKRLIKYRQKQLNQMFAYVFIMNVIIILVILLFAFVRTCQNNQIEGERKSTAHESISYDQDAVISPATVLLSEVL